MTLTLENMQMLQSIVREARAEKAVTIQVQIDLFAALVDAAAEDVMNKIIGNP